MPMNQSWTEMGSQKHIEVEGTRFGFGDGTDAKGDKRSKSTIM